MGDGDYTEADFTGQQIVWGEGYMSPGGAALSDVAPKTQTGILHLCGLSDVHVPPGLCRRPVDRIDEMGA